MRNCFFLMFFYLFSQKPGKKIKNVNYNVLHIFLDQLLALNSFLILISLPDQKKNIYQQKKKNGEKNCVFGEKNSYQRCSLFGYVNERLRKKKTKQQ